jgi:hypothetical protein
MSGIKIHLESAELAVVERFATHLNIKPEDIAYAALNRLMNDCERPEVRDDIVQTREWRKDNLPLWADTARSVHAYEGKSDAHPEERLKF